MNKTDNNGNAINAAGKEVGRVEGGKLFDANGKQIGTVRGSKPIFAACFACLLCLLHVRKEVKQTCSRTYVQPREHTFVSIR